MYEHLAYIFGGSPNEHHNALYSEWARHGWAMVITGNVQVSASHLSLGRDMVIPVCITQETMAPFRKLAHNMGDAISVMQLNHAGRQSSNIIGGRLPFRAPLAPSAVRVEGRSEGYASTVVHRLLFQTPKAMTLQDIEDVIADFIRGAELALKAGFDGVQLHVAHGCELYPLFLCSDVDSFENRLTIAVSVSQGKFISPVSQPINNHRPTSGQTSILTNPSRMHCESCTALSLIFGNSPQKLSSSVSSLAPRIPLLRKRRARWNTYKPSPAGNSWISSRSVGETTPILVSRDTSLPLDYISHRHRPQSSCLRCHLHLRSKLCSADFLGKSMPCSPPHRIQSHS